MKFSGKVGNGILVTVLSCCGFGNMFRESLRFAFGTSPNLRNYETVKQKLNVCVHVCVCVCVSVKEAFIMHCSSLRRPGMARVNEQSHSFTCHPHVYT